LIINGGFLSLLKRLSRRFLRYVDALYQKWVQMCILVSARKYDAILIQWLPLPKHFIERLLRQNPNLVFDYDDAVFLGSEVDTNFILANSRIIIAGNQYLKDYANKFNRNVVVIPSCIPLDKFDACREEKQNIVNCKVVIGWIGSQGTIQNMDILREVFHSLADKYSLQLSLVGIGNRKSPIPEEGKLEVIKVPYYNEEEMISCAFSFDIGINPVKEDEVAKGKTSLKTLIYMGAGLPVISSPVGGNLEVIIDGVNGCFASTPDEWLTKLTLLIENSSIRKEMGRKGLSLVKEKYTTEHCFKLFIRTLISSFMGLEERDN
jgi:glycosyltransferase involved in cell wall biosynthesis